MGILIRGDRFLKLGHSHAPGADSGQRDRCDPKNREQASRNRTSPDQRPHLHHPDLFPDFLHQLTLAAARMTSI
jgi:hypothetical protein